MESWSFSFFTALAGCTTLVVIAFAFWGEYTRKSQFSGYLSPNMDAIDVYAPLAGTVIEKYVCDGQVVKTGDTLYVLSTENSSLEVAQDQALAIERIKTRRESLETQVLEQAHVDQIQYRLFLDRLHGMQRKLMNLNSQIAIQHQHLADAASSSLTHQQLLSKRLVSERQAQKIYNDWLNHQARLQALQRDKAVLNSEIRATQVDLDRSQIKFKTQRAASERAISNLTEILADAESRRNFVIAAPQSGTVTSVFAEQGQNTTTANPLLSILPQGAKLQAQLLVPSNAVGFVERGQTVSVRYHAFPHQRFGSHHGQIVEIAKTSISTKETALPEPFYRVTVEIESQAMQAFRQDIPLQSGMLLDADIWLDHRRLIEWVIDPLFSMLGRV